MTVPYRSLDPDQVIERVQRLRRRIDERFGDRNLSRVCTELEAVARETQERVRQTQEPIHWLRWSVGGAIALLVLAAVFTASQLTLDRASGITVLDLVQTLDAVFNEVVLIGAALVFLVRTERRVKQRRTLHALHELRSLAYVIDEHQTDKDPDRVLGYSTPTASSPTVELEPPEILRYLIYCSEMLSTIGKLAALYIQDFDDDVAVAVVTEVEELALSLSRNVWQKIMILHSDPRFVVEHDAVGPRPDGIQPQLG